MIKRVACPVVPAPSGPLTTATVNKSCIFEQSQAGDKKYHQELLYPPHPDQVHHQSHYQQPSNLVYHPLLGPNQQHLPPSLPSSLQSLAVSSGSKSNNSSLVSLDIHAKNPSKYNNNLHRYSCISSSTATSSSSSSDRSEVSVLFLFERGIFISRDSFLSCLPFLSQSKRLQRNHSKRSDHMI